MCVLARPTIESFCRENGVEDVCIGKDKTLICTASGVPHPDVVITGVHSSTLSTNVSTILLTPAVEADKGSYTCTANNTHDVVTKTCTVIIGGGLYSCSQRFMMIVEWW